VLRHKNRQTEK